MTLIQTRFGHDVDLLDPQPETLDLRDIAYSLSGLRRFNAHAQPHYCVAEHSFWVARLIESETVRRDLTVAALMHDAAEAYLADVPLPVKQALRVFSAGDRSVYDQLTDIMDAAIARRFDLPALSDADEALVKDADERLRVAEQHRLMPWQSSRATTAKGAQRDTALLVTIRPVELCFPVGDTPAWSWSEVFLAEFHRLTENAHA